MNEMKTLPLAFTYVGVFLGAGFVWYICSCRYS